MFVIKFCNESVKLEFSHLKNEVLGCKIVFLRILTQLTAETPVSYLNSGRVSWQRVPF